MAKVKPAAKAKPKPKPQGTSRSTMFTAAKPRRKGPPMWWTVTAVDDWDWPDDPYREKFWRRACIAALQTSGFLVESAIRVADAALAAYDARRATAAKPKFGV